MCVLYGDTVAIRLSGRFDHLAHREFRVAVDRAVANPAVKSLHVDLGAVDGIDASAFGLLRLLLVCRAVAKKAGKTISLGNATGIMKRALDVGHFWKLFVINQTLPTSFTADQTCFSLRSRADNVAFEQKETAS